MAGIENNPCYAEEGMATSKMVQGQDSPMAGEELALAVVVADDDAGPELVGAADRVQGQVRGWQKSRQGFGS